MPKPSKATRNPVGIPKCWVECNGKQIPSGMWAGQKTPDLNNAGRFLRGGTQVNALELQEDAVQEHTHYLTDPGHNHKYRDYGGDGFMALPGVGPWVGGTGYPYTWKTTTGISVNGVKTGRQSFETRPKNMKVTFIMKIC